MAMATIQKKRNGCRYDVDIRGGCSPNASEGRGTIPPNNARSKKGSKQLQKRKERTTMTWVGPFL